MFEDEPKSDPAPAPPAEAPPNYKLQTPDINPGTRTDRPVIEPPQPQREYR